MKDIVIGLQVIGLLTFIIGYIIEEIQERIDPDNAWGIFICMIGGFIMLVTLFFFSS